MSGSLFYDHFFLVGWFWQGFLHFYGTIPLASNENTALKLEVKHEHNAMLEQEYALLQPQNEAFNRNHHFNYNHEAESGFSVITVTKTSQHIPSASLTAFINYSVLPSRPCEASLSWALMYQCWRRKGHRDAFQILCWKRGFVELGRVGEHSIWALNSVVQWGQTVVVWHNTALKKDIVWTWMILSSTLTPLLLQRHIQYSRLALT